MQKGVSTKKKSNQDNHFTLLGFTALANKPIMCCVIMEGILQNSIAETGVDHTKEWVGDVEYPRFFEANFGKIKDASLFFARARARKKSHVKTATASSKLN